MAMPRPLRWNGLRYRDPDTGRYLSRTTVRRALEQSLANLVRRTDALADDLRAGRISLNTWREEMRLTIKQTQMAAAEVANGGRAQMTQADYGRVGQQVRRQYEYLENWVREIQNGSPIDGRIEGRARQYLRAARSSFLALEGERMNERGYFARNVLSPAEHCAECLAETAKGLVPISHLTLPGHRTCRGNCKCFLLYEKVA